jgi:hypothetical protein
MRQPLDSAFGRNRRPYGVDAAKLERIPIPPGSKLLHQQVVCSALEYTDTLRALWAREIHVRQLPSPLAPTRDLQHVEVYVIVGTECAIERVLWLSAPPERDPGVGFSGG